ncbi:unnamed protein product [Sphenostylis stenocarpa]|uniref:UDP-glycosyltransferase n=1 Tax=Sphenostylis stenocarpa TaxID=92480 RepID=A0AA86RMZ9_9FABA|nr:unnamed protein product [Sphenostylis stenocarpa]
MEHLFQGCQCFRLKQQDHLNGSHIEYDLDLESWSQLGIKGALLWPASATCLTLCDCIPRLIHDGVIDSYGIPGRRQKIQLSPNMPLMDTENFPWRGHDKLHFDHLVQEMEEDTSCLEWLDQQLPQSVVYVSFGSMAVIGPNQFKELALGIDLLDKPFLWVVRASNDNKVNINTYSNDFHGKKGRIVGWAPQKKILKQRLASLVTVVGILLWKVYAVAHPCAGHLQKINLLRSHTFVMFGRLE